MSEPAKEWKKRHRDRRLASCRHFTGIQHDTCRVGVRYLSVRDTSGPGMAKWPCLGEDCVTRCDKKVNRTPEEVDAEDRAIAEALAHTATARMAIIATKQSRGAIDCPKCGGKGALRFSVSSYNGHVHAGCTTKDCLAWME